MKDGLSDLLPSRAIARRMHELETELERARAYRRQHSKSPETLGRWGLEQPPVPQQEEGWFITYLDMMTLLLVVMIVMLAFSGNLAEGDRTVPPEPVSEPAPGESTAPAASLPQPGDGLLPAGSALFPEQAVQDTAVLSEPLPGWTATWALPELPIQPGEDMAQSAAPEAAVPAPPPSLPPSGRSHLYPGFSNADLAASFIGPPRPRVPATAAAPPDTTGPEIPGAPTEPDPPSEGETRPPACR